MKPTTTQLVREMITARTKTMADALEKAFEMKFGDLYTKLHCKNPKKRHENEVFSSVSGGGL